MLEYPFFDGASLATRAQLHRRSTTRSFAAGSVLFHQGDPPNELFAIDAGRGRLWRGSEDGDALTLAYAHAGDLIGTVAAALGKPQAATATAVNDVVATSWSGAAIRALIADDAHLASGVAAVIAGRAELLIDRLEELAPAQVEQRVARTLVRLGAEIGQDHQGRAVALALTQNEVADLTQSTVPTVSRILSRWRAGGIVRGGRGSIIIVDLAALCGLGHIEPPAG